MVAVAIFILALALPAEACGAAPIHSNADIEASVDASLRRVVAFIYDGRLDSATVAVEQAAALAPGDPRIGLFRFRVLRENYPDDINEEDRAQTMVPRMIAPLDQTIASCDSILKLDKGSQAGLLYRGWARMMKAQVYAIATQIWSAGTEARKGKGDLDRYRERHPNDPDAQVIVGGYLYFADILPRMVKFVKFLVRVPGGDRDRGIELMAASAGKDTYTGTDALVVLAVIDYLFEGQVEEAIQIFGELGERHPYNPRVCELLGSTANIHPETSMRSLEILNRVIDGWNGRVRGWGDLWLYRMLVSRARILNQIGEHQAARADLQAIVAAAPRDPYWMMPRALISLASLNANLGLADSARATAQRVLDNSRYQRYHSQARALQKLQVSPRQQQIFLELARVRRHLYGRDRNPDSARVAIAAIRSRFGNDMRLTFLEAELDREVGKQAQARAAYQALIERALDSGFESIRLTSLIRLGEIEIAEGSYAAAKTRYEEAQRLESGATLLGNMIRGRLRFIEGAKEGKSSRNLGPRDVSE
jgi:tetratricopeptide (TPR) repeat protein